MEQFIFLVVKTDSIHFFGMERLRQKARARVRGYLGLINARLDSSIQRTPAGNLIQTYDVRNLYTDAPLSLPENVFSNLVFGFTPATFATVNFTSGGFAAPRTISNSLFNGVSTLDGISTKFQQQLTRILNHQSSADGYSGPTVDELENPLILNTSQFSYVRPPRIGHIASIVGLDGVAQHPSLLKMAEYETKSDESCWVTLARFLRLPCEEIHPGVYWTWEQGNSWLEQMVGMYNDVHGTNNYIIYLDPNRIFQQPTTSREQYMTTLLFESSRKNTSSFIFHNKTIFRAICPEIIGEWGGDPIFVLRFNNHVHAGVGIRTANDYVSPEVNPIAYMDHSGQLFLLSLKKTPHNIPPQPVCDPSICLFWQLHRNLMPFAFRRYTMADWKLLYNLPKGTKISLVSDPTTEMIKQGDTVYVFYDVETIVDGRLQTYSVAYFEVSQKEIDDPETDVTTWTSRVRLIIGPDCMKQFVMWIGNYIKMEKAREVIITGFNSARFDNYFLLEAFYYSSNVMPNMERVFFQGTSLLQARISAFNIVTKSLTKCHLLDVAKLLPASSLDNLGKSFKTHFQKVAGFNHDEVQKMFITHGWNFLDDQDFITKLREYNINDVLVLAELLRKFRKTLAEAIPTSFVQFNKDGFPATLGGLSKRHWELSIEPFKEEWLPPEILSANGGDLVEKLSPDEYRELRMGTLGGRCSLIHGPMACDFPTRVLDAASLYPTVMAVWNEAYYPIGRKLLVDKFDPEHLGIYRCHVSQSQLRSKNLIYLVARKEFLPSGAPFRNNWEVEDIYNIQLTTPELLLIKDAGCTVDIQSGIVWSHKVKGCELFRCLLVFMKIKKEQDRRKEDGEPFNPALRAFCKYMMNSLYGKMLEKLPTDSTFSVTPTQLDLIQSRVDSGEFIYVKSIKPICGEVFVRVLKSVESIIDKQSPFIFGAYVLGLSRTYMARYLWLRIPRDLCYYIDTDCLHMASSAIKKVYRKHMQERVAAFPEAVEFDPDYLEARLYRDNTEDPSAPRLNVIGCFTDDTPGDSDGILFGGKKLYAFRRADGSSSTDPGGHCIAVKGVSKKDICLSPFLAQSFLSMPSLSAQEALRNFYIQASNNIQVGQQGVPLITDLLQNGQAYVVCRQLRTVGSGVHASRSMDFGYLFETFTVKLIRREGETILPPNIVSSSPLSYSKDFIKQLFNRTYMLDPEAPDAILGHDVYNEPDLEITEITN